MLTRALRTMAIVVATVLISVGLTVPANAAAGPAADVFRILNEERTSRGLPELLTDPTLDNAAWQWANYLASTGQFLHSTSEWRDSMIRDAGWIHSGENIAAGYTTAASVMSGWMGSTGHRANILNTNYVGVGVAYVAGGPYGHYWVQIFASSHPRVPAGSTPVIAGTPAIGSTLTASTSGWPSGTSLGWSWQADGKTIPGATSTTYVPTLSDSNRKITATVTGWLPGYYTTTKISKPTSVVTGGPSSERISGADRFATSVAISKAGFASGVPVLYVASGMDFPDALGAAPAAALGGGPLLLTHPDTLPTTVASEIKRLAPARIVVVGGLPSVSESVFAQLKALAPEVTRLSGSDRFATSLAIASDAYTSASIAYIATGLNFPDALTASAAAAKAQAPVLLVHGGSTTVSDEAVALMRSLGVTTVRIAGSAASVSNGIQSALSSAGFTVQRLAGADRFQTAIAINEQAFSTAPAVYLASGATFPDALAGAALAGSKGAPLYVALGTCIPTPVSASISKMGATKVVLLGGAPSLSAAVATFERC